MKNELIKFKEPPRIAAAYSVVGKKESNGPLGSHFHLTDQTDTFGMDTWEKSESEMQRLAVKGVLNEAGISECDVDALFAGDLTNQCVSSNYGLKGFKIPFFGLYGACSTAAEGLILSAMCIGGGIFENTIAVTSSHNCSAERQFRYPLEYGGQHSPTAQWTVTGAGSFAVTREGKHPTIEAVLPGKTVDQGITDINNMGAAMAPAAIDTLTRFFQKSKTSPADYDLIVTGDLGYEGHRIVKELMLGKGIDMGKRYDDCGLMMYDRKRQDVHAGGSGCGCSAAVFAAYLYPKLCRGELKNMLFIGTGALMSPSSVQQGLSIPGIAHLVHLKGCEE